MTTAKISRRGLLHSGVAVAVTAAMIPCFPVQAQSPAGAWAARKKKRDIRGLKMAYYEVGEGDPIVFLQGNPTSSYPWRNIIPYVQHLGRCIAPDMIGMGDSDRLPDSGPGTYTFVTHRDYLFELFDALGVQDKVVFVLHDWGAAVGFSWAQRHPDRVKGIAYAEAILRRPDMPRPEPTAGPFTILRSPAGEEAVLQNNMFVEQLLLGGLQYYLTEEDKVEYRRPYLEPGESRRPTLSWPREVPFGGQPKVNDDLIKSYSEWLAHDAHLPKLFIRAVPGAILPTRRCSNSPRASRTRRRSRSMAATSSRRSPPTPWGASWRSGSPRWAESRRSCPSMSSPLTRCTVVGYGEICYRDDASFYGWLGQTTPIPSSLQSALKEIIHPRLLSVTVTHKWGYHDVSRRKRLAASRQ